MAIPEREIGWHGDTLAYQLLAFLDMKIAEAIYNRDWESYYYLLEEQYVFAWPNIKVACTDEEGKKHSKEWWEQQWKGVRQKLFAPVNFMDNPEAERQTMQNISAAKQQLHDLQMILVEYEVEVGMRITTREKGDAGRAMLKFGT